MEWGKWRRENPDIQPDLSDLHFKVVVSEQMNYQAKKYPNGGIWMNPFSYFDFSNVNLSGAHLSDCNFADCSFYKANLSGARFLRTQFINVDFRHTIFDNAACGHTVFGDVDLSLSTGLETTQHYGLSMLGTDTYLRSKGRIPDVFLRGCGIPDNVIAVLPSLVAETLKNPSLQILYHVDDQAFVDQLHQRLTASGFRVWLHGRDYWLGDKERQYASMVMGDTFDYRIVCSSQSSLASKWFNITDKHGVHIFHRRPEGEKGFVILDLDGRLRELDTPQPLVGRLQQKTIQPYNDWQNADTFDESFDYLVRWLRGDRGETSGS